MLTLDLSGHRAVVTGGAGELGHGICRALRSAGAEVALTYRSKPERAEAFAAEIGGRAYAADVTDRASIERLAASLQADGGMPDIVVANAVVQYDWKSVLDQPLEDFRSQYESCVEHMVHLAQVFAPAMIAGGWGRIIAINTECSMQSGAGMGAYAAGKRGMDGIVRVLARELGPSNITVNQVAPGWMASERIREQEGDPQAGYRANVPLRRNGTEDDIGNAVAFLASDLANFISGVYLPVSGGTVMPCI